jgi:hypothetical protein
MTDHPIYHTYSFPKYTVILTYIPNALILAHRALVKLVHNIGNRVPFGTDQPSLLFVCLSCFMEVGPSPDPCQDPLSNLSFKIIQRFGHIRDFLAGAKEHYYQRTWTSTWSQAS